MVKIELGSFEQVFKIPESDVAGLDDVKKLITEELLANSIGRFISMREDWQNAFTKLNL